MDIKRPFGVRIGTKFSLQIEASFGSILAMADVHTFFNISLEKFATKFNKTRWEVNGRL